MALSRRIARPMLASIFVVEGFDALRNPMTHGATAQAVVEAQPEGSVVGTSREADLARVNGGVQIVAGALLAIGKFRRVASLLLIGTLIPTTYANGRFWEESDQAVRSLRMRHFLRNLGLLGGLILAAFDTEGAPSLGWRAKRGVHNVEEKIAGHLHAQEPAVKANAKAVAKSASKAGRRARRAGVRARRGLGAVASESAEKLGGVREGVQSVHDLAAQGVRDSSGKAVQVVEQAAALVAEAVREAEPIVESAVRSGIDVATDALAKVEDRLAAS